MFRRLMLLFALVALAAFVAFVWPSAWRYDHVTVGGETYPVRIHRIRGTAEILVPEQGWVPADQPWGTDDVAPDAGSS